MSRLPAKTVFADVIITNPARPERGKVRVEGNGSVYWECYGDEIPGGLPS